MSIADFQKVLKEVKNPPKTKKAKIKTKAGYEFEYWYADLPDILDTIKPTLEMHGFSLYQSFQIKDGLQILNTTILKGDFHIISEMIFPPINDAQMYGAQATYYRKVAVCCLLGVTGDSDDDGNTIVQPKAKLPNFAPKDDLKKPIQQQDDSQIKPPGDYMIPFGKKYINQKLKDIPERELKSYRDYLKKSEKPSKQGIETIEYMNAYLGDK